MGDGTIFTFLINNISILGILLSSFYIFRKAVRHPAQSSQTSLSVLWSMISTALFAVRPFGIHSMLLRLLICVASIIFIYLLTKQKLDTIISAFLFSFGISYVLYYVASFAVFLISAPYASREHVPGTPINFNQPINLFLYSLTFIGQLSFAFLLFRVRRFRNGFPFLFKRYAIILTLISTGIILILVTWFRIISISENVYPAYIYFAGIVFIGIGIFIWIRRGIKKFQRSRIQERNEEILQQEVTELTQKIQHLNETNEILRAANHSVNHRLSAMERRFIGILVKGQKYEIPAEFSEELTLAITDIRKLSDEYSAEVSHVKIDKILPSTNIKMLDEMFKLFAERFSNNNIYFKLKVNGSIIYMVENIVNQSKLETMIGDHLQDALIAVNAGDSSGRSILALIGESGCYYEFSVHDSGIPFEVDTLQLLGMERITTHAEEGGSGVGFMRTFETMRECGASLIIKENKPGGAFSKSITIRFDSKNQYIIDTYRPELLQKNDRYTILST